MTDLLRPHPQIPGDLGSRRYVEVRPGEYAKESVQPRGAPVLMEEDLSYRASATGGRVAFQATTGLVPIVGTGQQELAVFLNPAASGMDYWLWFGEFQATMNTAFQRFRNSTITGLGTPRPTSNTGGGPQASSAGLYIAGQYTSTGGVVSKTALIGAYQQYAANIHNSVRLRPGNALHWTITGPGSGNPSYTASIYLEWSEVEARP